MQCLLNAAAADYDVDGATIRREKSLGDQLDGVYLKGPPTDSRSGRLRRVQVAVAANRLTQCPTYRQMDSLVAVCQVRANIFIAFGR